MHPGISLEEAIGRAETFLNEEHFNQVPAVTALEHWGYGKKSSSGQRVLAALNHYGLFEQSGQGSGRKVRLSGRGKVLLLKEQNDPEWIESCRDAALAPTIHRKLWDKWSEHGQLPSDKTIRWELMQMGFNPKTIQSFSRTFRATLEFANLLDDGVRDTPSGGSDASDLREPEPDAPAEEPESSPRTADRPMPSTDAVTTKDWDLDIPLVSGGQAVLRIPIPLSETDFELVKAVVNANLNALKQSITRKPAEMEDPDEE